MIPPHIESLFEQYPDYQLIETKDGIEIEYCDAIWPLIHPLDIELGCYRANWKGNAFQHLKKAHHIAWPNLVATWHDWTEERYYEFCQPHKIIVWAGGANIGKSVDAGCLGLLFWWSNPTQRTVLVGSTTITDLDNRIFGYMKKYHDMPTKYGINVPGHLYTSAPPKIIIDKKDTIHGIFAVALLKGNKDGRKKGLTNSARSSNLIGRHPEEGFLAIIDEGPDVSPSFMDAFSNWDKSPLFKCIVIGNSADPYDPHGLLATPMHGWGSIHPDVDVKWFTKNGVCLYFDCYRSPAIIERDPEKKRLLSIFLPTTEKIEEDKIKYGDDSPDFWRMSRGFWAPESASKTILSPLTIDKHHAKLVPRWSGEVKMIKVASLDPSFTAGGDSVIFRCADIGKDLDGRWIVDFGGPDYVNYLRLDARSVEPLDYQIVAQAKQLAGEAGIDPENIAVDITGTGMGIGSIIQKEWSKKILLVASNEACSSLPVMLGKDILAKDVYDRKATELVFMLQRFILADQVRGLEDITCQQLCTRRYERIGKKLSIEKKMDYKVRLGKVDSRYRSPDEMDAACLIIELIRHRFGMAPNSGANIANTDDSPMRRFFNSKRLLDGDKPDHGAYDIQPDYSEDKFSPIDWNDGFVHSQFEEDSDYETF